MSEEVKTPPKRAHDVAPSPLFAEFMKTGWSPTPLAGMSASDVTAWTVARRNKLSEAFPGIRLVIPAGNFKVRSNDCDYRFRPHSAFAYYTGVQGSEATADAVFVMEPTGAGHQPLLFINPRSTRDTDAFYRDARYGELWVGRRYTVDEAQTRYEIETRTVASLEDFLKTPKESLVIRDQDKSVDTIVSVHERDAEFATFVSAQRLIKDS